MQAYFAGLAVMVVLVASAAGAYVYVQAGADAQQAATNDANFAARKASAEIVSSFDLIRQTSEPITNSPSGAQILANPTGCLLGYAPVGVFDSGHIDLIASNGDVACTSLKSKPSTGVYAGQPWLTVVVPTIVAPTTDPNTGSQVAIVAYPIAGRGVMAWFLDLTPVGAKLATQFGSGVDQLEFLVTNARTSTIITRSIDPAKWTGAAMQGTPFAAATDPVARTDVGGTTRWYGESNAGSSGWKVYVGADRATALATAGQLQQRQLVIIAVGLAAVLLAMYVAYRGVARPIASLSTAVRATRGLESPLPVPVRGPAQVAALGEDINNLLLSLKKEWSERESAEQTYLKLFSGSPLPMFVADPKTGQVLEVNDAAATAFGYMREEFTGINGRDLVVAGNDEERYQLSRMRARESAVFDRYGPIGFHRKDGSVMRALVTSYEVGYAGRPARVSMIEDVTDREKVEHQHQEAMRLESLGQLAGGVAHDFNNLLAVILNVTGSLKAEVAYAVDDPLQRAEVARDLERVDKAAQSASRLTRQLLAFARRQVVQRSVLDLSEHISTLTELLRRTLGSHIQLTATLRAGLWPVLMDPGHIEQVVINLAVNARDAMPNGGTLAISTANSTVDEASAHARPGLTPGRYVELQVSDTGTGMDRATLDHVFEPFFTTKPAGQGTGLGLATVYGIVKQEEGNISIDSEVGRGTTVTVLIPASEDAVAVKVPVVLPRLESRTGTVLVVEDYADLRELIEEILKGAGYRVISAPDGGAALALARSHRGTIDVVLTDVVMPKMLGTDLAAQLRLDSPGLRVLFMSGHAQPALGAAASLDPDAPLLQKPFMAAELLEKLQQVFATPAGTSTATDLV